MPVELLTTPAREKAWYEGYQAGKAGLPPFANPYSVGALFDPEQLAESWIQGRQAGVDRRYTKRRRHAWNRA